MAYLAPVVPDDHDKYYNGRKRLSMNRLLRTKKQNMSMLHETNEGL